MATTLDSNLSGIFKIWYSDKSPEDVFFRNSPVVKKIPKTRIGGKSYNVPLLLGNGGSASGSLIASTTNATANGSAPNVEFAVTNGQIFATFFVTQQEVLASQNIRGAYQPVVVNKMAQNLDSFRKLAATSLYGTGYGEIGVVGTAITVATGSQTLDVVNKSTVVKLSIGSVFSFTDGATPSSTLRTSKNTVTGINGTVITFTATVADGAVLATDLICLDGCRNGTTPLLPRGLGAWLPKIGDRTGTAWDTYIATEFYGVDRSVNVEGAAGQFIIRDSSGSEKYTDAIVRGVEAVRTAGGMPDLLVLNTTDYNTITAEMNTQTSLFQSINTGAKANKNSVAKGISDMKFAMATTWVENVWDDPFCPIGTAYILESDTMEFACLTNSDAPLNDGVSENAPGKESLTDFKAPDTSYYWLIEDYITSQPGTNTINGPALQIIVQLYGSWVVHNPSKCAVINIAG